VASSNGVEGAGNGVETGVGSGTNASETVNAVITPSGSVPTATVGCGTGVEVGSGMVVGVGVGGTEVAGGTGVSVATGIDVAVGGTSVGVGGTTVGVLVGTGVDVGGMGTRVAVAGRVVGTTVSTTVMEVGIGACCSAAVEAGTAAGVLADVGAAELDVQPDATISTNKTNSGVSRATREILNDFFFTDAETT
jgi:hypothetical protein